MNPRIWIKSASYDWWWFIAPLVIPPIVVIFIPGNFLNAQKTEIFPWSWILIVLSIDVAHVYTTVFKTYFKPTAFKIHRFKLLAIPFLVWAVGAMIYSFSGTLFWSVVAYFAVFHFIRQQYGFFRLYSRNETALRWRKWILTTAIYAMTVIPILIWHARGQRNFNWMTKGDFFYINNPMLTPILNSLLIIVTLLYLYVEYAEAKDHGRVNWPRVLLTLGTGFSYYVSIVISNNDFVFSLVNVIGHGIPYLALVYLSEKKELNEKSSPVLKLVLAKWGWILFYAIVFAFAYFEETLWDVFINRENNVPFGWLYNTVQVIDDHQLKTLFIPVLIMPQIVHYILDGYIWRKKDYKILQ